MTAPLLELNDGRQMPALGFGTYLIDGPDAPALMGTAIDAGYRLLDTATRYENEVEVGEAVRASSGLEPGDAVEVVGVELEVEDVEVAAEPLGRG